MSEHKASPAHSRAAAALAALKSGELVLTPQVDMLCHRFNMEPADILHTLEEPDAKIDEDRQSYTYYRLQGDDGFAVTLAKEGSPQILRVGRVVDVDGDYWMLDPPEVG